MGAFNIGVTTVITTDATYIHESFSTVGFGTTENTKITASDAAADDQFGVSVAVGCGRIVVGAHQDDDAGSSSGSAYIFDLNGNQQRKITASDAAAGDRFGHSVAVGSGRIVVGASGDDIGVNNSQGSAYIFDLNGTQLAKITASDGDAADQFGTSVAAGSGKIVVGAFSDDIGANSSQGSAYIFDLNGTQLAKITASDGAANDFFGESVAAGCGKIVVGAFGQTSQAGAAYIFDFDGNQLKKLVSPDGVVTGVKFGHSVAVGNGRIVVGAYDSNSSGTAYLFDLSGEFLKKILPTTGNNIDFGTSVAVGNGRIVVGAPLNDVNGNGNQGAAYIYDLDGNLLTQIVASDGAVNDQFGRSVAVGSGRIVVGVYGDDVGANIDQGSAYIFNLPEDSNIYWERILDTYKY